MMCSVIINSETLQASLFELNFVMFKILQIRIIPAFHCKGDYFRRELMGPSYEALKLTISIGVKNCINLKDYDTYRTIKSMVKLCERTNGLDEGTLEIQQAICVHRFASRVSTYFSVSFFI